ncbi:uncharacterized protein LOC106137828 isoform X1 [Amyelois transitella]|uniref:uncharacterized protein LOC106137828 isoform X1 n=1 Tax=Amyelois transitella TaxID=680683 RepID=UPI0029902F56|nr:uncharacterized protein LOC106137828 isoform X1 [Amyelois transitella]
MNSFDTQFVTELFLDSNSNTTISRLAVTIANVIYENNENVNTFNEVLTNEFSNVLQSVGEHTEYHHSKNSYKCKNSGFYEKVVKTLSDVDYISNFRMKRSTAKALLQYLQENVEADKTNMLLDKKLHIFIFILTSDLSFNDVAALFCLQKSSVRNIFYDIAAMLSGLTYYLINWPSPEEQHITRLKVLNRFQFPNCVGFIDSFRFKAGSRRTKKASLDTVLLQAVCDESLMFIDIHVGSMGKTKKYKVFKESKLSQELKNFVDFDSHILGDSEYKLKYNLMTPFTAEELLTSEEMKYNEVHWKTRSYIGHAFEMLKERFKKLSHLDLDSPQAVGTILRAACVLHNFILLHEGAPVIKEEPTICDNGADEIILNIDTNIVKSSVEKRQFICNYINYMSVNNLLQGEAKEF